MISIMYGKNINKYNKYSNYCGVTVHVNVYADPETPFNGIMYLKINNSGPPHKE